MDPVCSVSDPDSGFFADPDPGFKSPDLDPSISKLIGLNDGFYKVLEEPDQNGQC